MTIDILSQINWISLEEVPKLPINVGFEGKNPKPIEPHHCKQVHGTHLVQANESSTGPQTPFRSEADAIWTFHNQKDPMTIAVKSADCLPVLFFIPNQEKNQPAKIAAAHAGWRGLSSGILHKTLRVLASPAAASEAYAFFGPCISPQRFEIGPEVVEAFRNASPFDITFCLTKGLRDRWFFDLAAYGAYELVRGGMKPEKIYVLRSCTYSNDQLWFSYRRNGNEGSNWSWISTLS